MNQHPVARRIIALALSGMRPRMIYENLKGTNFQRSSSRISDILRLARRAGMDIPCAKNGRMCKPYYHLPRVCPKRKKLEPTAWKGLI